MNEIQQVAEIVMLTGEHVMTDSRRVAEAFGKRHKNVLGAIRKAEAEAPDDAARLNFQLCLENNDLQNGKPQPYYLLTKDGFMAVALAFTGQRAAEVRWAFIRAFNEMSEFIRTQAYGAWRQYEVAHMEFRHEQDHASRCGSDLAAWKNRKLVHIARLERLDPQIKLPLYVEKAA